MAFDAKQLPQLFSDVGKVAADFGVEYEKLETVTADDQLVTDVVDALKDSGMNIQESEYATLRPAVALALNVLALIVRHKEDPATLGKNLFTLIQSRLHL